MTEPAPTRHRRFRLVESGTTGTDPATALAEGVQFSDGFVAVRWLDPAVTWQWLTIGHLQDDAVNAGRAIEWLDEKHS